MKFNVNHIFLYLSFSSIFLMLNACNNSATEHAEHSPATEEEHEHNTATLTQAQMEAVDMQFGKIEYKELTATIQANGVLNVPNNSRAIVSSLYGGVVKTLNIEMGNIVRKGQVLATIGNPQFIQLQEDYLSTGSKIIFAEQEQQRQKDLSDGNAGALKNLQSATAELNALRTRKASLEQQLNLLGVNPHTLSIENIKPTLAIISPINGTVSSISAKLGSHIDASSPIAEIVDNASLHLDLHIFEKDLPKIKIGQIIHFTLTNNPINEYDAKVYSIGTSFENESKTVSVHCDVTGNKTGLIDGMNITAIVSLNNATSPAVPNDAIVNSEAKNYIFIVTNKDKNTFSFEKIEVVKGVSNMGYTAVTLVKDIAANAEIVTQGAFFINAKLINTGEHEH